MAKKLLPVNTALEILEIHEHSGDVVEYRVPPAFSMIYAQMQQAMDAKTPVLIESSDLGSANSVVIELAYVTGRWCMGYQTILYYGEEVKVPYTIHYSDLFVMSKNNVAPRRLKIVVKGENPFGERP